MIQPFDPLAFLVLAQQLASQDRDEARLRTAVGRAYYALFLIAREKTSVRKRRNVHKEVINALKKRKAYWSTADMLRMLFRLRTVADYELLPKDAAERNWTRNWSMAQYLINRILPKLQAW
jgi:hypothetical protein